MFVSLCLFDDPFAIRRLCTWFLSFLFYAGALPGAKLKQFTAKKRNRNTDADDENRSERQILMEHVLAGTISTSQAWRHLTSTTPAFLSEFQLACSSETSAQVPRLNPAGHEQYLYDDGTPIIDPVIQTSSAPQWIWVSPRDAAQDFPAKGTPFHNSSARPYFEPSVARERYRAGMGQGQATCDALAPSLKVAHHAELLQTYEPREKGSSSTNATVQVHSVLHLTPPSGQGQLLEQRVGEAAGSHEHDRVEGPHGASIKQADTSLLNAILANRKGSGRRPGDFLPSRMPAPGTVSVVDGSQRGESWGLRAGDRPWK